MVYFTVMKAYIYKFFFFFLVLVSGFVYSIADFCFKCLNVIPRILVGTVTVNVVQMDK